MLDLMHSIESNKRELQLSINSFDNPTELSEIKAWSQLMLQLIFLEPGTYPSLPEMGVGIEHYQFDFMDEAINDLNTRIIQQQQTYLKEVPLKAVQCSSAQTPNGDIILLIQLMFNVKMGSQAATAIAVNATPTSRHFLDFEVSWN